MTWIKAPQDDASVRNIRRSNATSTAISNPAKIAPGEDKAENQTQVNFDINFKNHERRKTDRRKQQRRQGSSPVVLDTRLQYDRRRSDRRKAEGSEQTLNHIDKYC